MNKESAGFFRKLFSKKALICVLGILFLLWGSFIFFGQQAKRNAAAIFNQEMSSQNAIQGKIQLGELEPHLDGTIYFKNLVWVDTNGDRLMKVKQGHIKVSPFDAIFGRMGTRSLQAINLENAEFIIRFNEKKHADIVPRQQALKDKKAQVTPAKPNIHLSDKLGRKHLILRNSIITVINNAKTYTLNEVNGNFDYNEGILNLDMKTGKFGGDMIGDSLELSGKVGTDKNNDAIDMQLTVKNIVPSSLNLGNISNSVSLTGKATGSLKHLLVDGKIYFHDLDLPKMHFSNLSGNYHYEDDIIHVTDIQGNIFDGTVDAFGEYNIQTRAHKIFITGHNLEAAQYFKAEDLHCRLQLNMEMLNDGTKYGTIYRGNFASGEGRLGKHSFYSLSSFFTIQNKDFHFNSIVLDTKIGEFHASRIDVVNKKFMLHGLSWKPHHKVKR